MKIEELAAEVAALRAELHKLRDEVGPVADSHKPEPDHVRNARPVVLFPMGEPLPPPPRLSGVPPTRR